MPGVLNHWLLHISSCKTSTTFKLAKKVKFKFLWSSDTSFNMKNTIHIQKYKILWSTLYYNIIYLNKIWHTLLKPHDFLSIAASTQISDIMPSPNPSRYPLTPKKIIPQSRNSCNECVASAAAFFVNIYILQGIDSVWHRSGRGGPKCRGGFPHLSVH